MIFSFSTYYNSLLYIPLITLLKWQTWKPRQNAAQSRFLNNGQVLHISSFLRRIYCTK